MKYYIQIHARKIRSKKYGFFSSGKWFEDLPLVALDYSRKGEVAACGQRALNYLKKQDDSIIVCNPFQSLEIWSEDLEFAEIYLRWFQQNYILSKLPFVPPLVVVQLLGYSRSLKEIERRMIKETFIHAGAREVRLYEEERELSDLELKAKIHVKDIVEEIKVPGSIITDWVEPVAGGDATR